MKWIKDNAAKTWAVKTPFATVVVWETGGGYSWEVDCVKRVAGKNTTLYRARQAAISAVREMAAEIYEDIQEWVD